MSTAVATTSIAADVERVLIAGDLGKLSAEQRVATTGPSASPSGSTR
jgi:hypothetical protein